MKNILIILFISSLCLANGLVGGIRPKSASDAWYLNLTGSNATSNIDIGSYDFYCDILDSSTAHIGGKTNYLAIDSSGIISFNGTASIVIPHLMQSDSTDQAIANINNAQVITFDTDVHHSGITRTSSSRFTITRAGSYLITFSGMGVGTATKVLQFWLKKNTDYVANSNTQYTFKGTGTNAVIACSFIEHFNVGDYFEFWTWGDDVSCKWDAVAAGSSPTRPAIPSIIITANFIGSD